MEHPKYLIDTNVIIDYLAQKLPSTGMAFMNDIIDATPCVSVITKIEVLGFNAPNEHYQLLKEFVNDSVVLDLSTFVAETCISIRRAHKTKLPDAIIAATAHVHELILITRNVADFKNISGLEIINAHEIGI